MKALAAALLLVCGHAVACSKLDVTVLPFNVVEDTSTKSAQAIEDMSDNVGMFGFVKVIFFAKVSGCKVTVGYMSPVLYVAKELEENACAEQHVLEHERGHVRIYREALATLASRIEARVGEPDVFKTTVSELEAVMPAQRAHDSSAEYSANRTACHGEILELAGGDIF